MNKMHYLMRLKTAFEKLHDANHARGFCRGYLFGIYESGLINKEEWQDLGNELKKLYEEERIKEIK